MLKTIGIKEVRLGMYIHELKGPWMDHPFWRSKFVLKDPADLQKLKLSQLREIVIDISLGLDVLPDEVEEHAPTDKELAMLELDGPIVTEEIMQPEVKPTTLEAEREQAAKIISSSRSAISSMFKDLRMGKAIEAEAVMPIVEEISASVSRNVHALISLVRLKTVDDYTYMHSVAVCALMTALARELKLSEAEVKQAALAGLMHDMGKAGIPLQILNKPGALTDNEFDVIRQHPKIGYDMLLKANVSDPVTLDVCLHHHEKVDGSGYPEKLDAGQISVFAKMGAICDVYDAVTSTRAYKPAWEPGIALKRMASWTGHFDPVVFKAFVKSLGIYPIGTVVILKSGRLAVVVKQTPESLLKPVVKAFFSTKSKMHIPVIELDLSKGMDEIVGNESAAAWGVGNIDHLWTNPS
ncbi:HD-GYP domain-containing protein [Methylophilus medardicus]|uniref:HD-GYP domain-containing protein n=1 Tax=Methylophilus medardicus TaxID=2588534 RepID=A0A5B8CQG3_9PROT|nr:HD-GYP domain-containing protein [Methylophilus medardicus]QDC43306.1 HD-GYP domain-containing protein [Methylophilus medardicus]QDC48313.1 HD-GYP domain-containing protein [Methylophilus medardicus]QDC52018.1 HD-GYP domain-containing protein [Methylophilus medardicus]